MGYRVIDPQERTLSHLREHALLTQALWIRPDDNHMSALHHPLAAGESRARLEEEGLLPRAPLGAALAAPEAGLSAPR
jgi:hypothetical protein